MRIMLVMTLLGMANPAGQIAKFDGRKPDGEYVSRVALEVVERCLIRVASPPQVYRQPDRPDEVMIVWTAGGVSAGLASGRVDLRRQAGGTKVLAWFPRKWLDDCAPSA